jgi:hypothetical protein
LQSVASYGTGFLSIWLKSRPGYHYPNWRVYYSLSPWNQMDHGHLIPSNLSFIINPCIIWYYLTYAVYTAFKITTHKGWHFPLITMRDKHGDPVNLWIRVVRILSLDVKVAGAVTTSFHVKLWELIYVQSLSCPTMDWYLSGGCS